MRKVISIVGQKFARWTVIDEQGRFVFCQCECGNTGKCLKGDVKRGHSKSCGCLRSETLANAARTHGMRRSVEYKSWAHIKSRTCNPSDAAYSNYGGRGITICDEWRESFETFFHDMGHKPDKGYSIERVNNSLGYCKSNCVWATAKQQARNRRSTVWITIQSDTKSLPEWCEIFNLNYKKVRRRLSDGWSVERAMIL